MLVKAEKQLNPFANGNNLGITKLGGYFVSGSKYVAPGLYFAVLH